MGWGFRDKKGLGFRVLASLNWCIWAAASSNARELRVLGWLRLRRFGFKVSSLPVVSIVEGLGFRVSFSWLNQSYNKR